MSDKETEINNYATSCLEKQCFSVVERKQNRCHILVRKKDT